MITPGFIFFCIFPFWAERLLGFIAGIIMHEQQLRLNKKAANNYGIIDRLLLMGFIVVFDYDGQRAGPGNVGIIINGQIFFASTFEACLRDIEQQFFGIIHR